MSTFLSLPKILPDHVRQTKLPPVVRAALLHAVCVVAALVLSAGWSKGFAWQGVEALLAVLGGLLIGLASWWIIINALFVPALSMALAADIPPYWALGAFSLMTLVYWGVGHTQVPLFLSSDTAARALLQLLPAAPRPRFLDLGCGDARLLARLAAVRRDGRFEGIEYAPLPWLAGWLRLLKSGLRCSVRWGNFWRRDLSGYDVVYAYLSPVPMARLWAKARREMRPGTVLVSNTFPVPGADAGEIIALDDDWGGCLYLYRM